MRSKTTAGHSLHEKMGCSRFLRAVFDQHARKLEQGGRRGRAPTQSDLRVFHDVEAHFASNK